MSIDDRVKRNGVSAAFVALVGLAVYWPAPIVAINEACCQAHLKIDGLSFLGRESRSWDVAFWCIAGLFLLALLQTFSFSWNEFQAPLAALRRAELERVGRVPLALGALSGLVAVGITWRFFDAPVTAWAERIDSPAVEDVIRLFNRLGGGMNPALIVIFFLIVGVISHHEPWVTHGLAMGLAGAGAGLLGQVIKLAAGRTRPELWLGPSRLAHGGATSFPSGHTLGAFALAGVLLFGSRSAPMRSGAIVLATAIGLSRILALRHWASDVVASAIIGLLAAYVADRALSSGGQGSPPGIIGELPAPRAGVGYASTSAKFTETRREQPASSIVTP